MNRPIPNPLLDALLDQLSTEKDCIFLETSKPTTSEDQSLLFTDPVDTLSLEVGQDLQAFFDKAQQALDHGLYLAGWFAYEFGYALEPSLHPLLEGRGEGRLARLGVYAAPRRFDHSQPLQQAPGPTSSASPSHAPFAIADLRASLSQDDYLSGLQRIKAYIEAGDTYQVNYTLKLLFNFSGSPEALYRTLRHNQPVGYSAYLRFGDHRLLSFSPELFFRKEGSLCQVRPMKGTMPRGRTPAEDQAIARALAADPKNRCENVMIVDLLRNDLGRLSSLGGVEMTSLFTVETYATLHQMTSAISGQVDRQAGLRELFSALFPCGSVTGAPKIRTMEIIAELEASPRGVYTGAIGYLAPSGDAVFNVPIRTIVLSGRHEGKGDSGGPGVRWQGEMGIGSGIVYDSNPEAEWQECLLKGKFLTEPRPEFSLIETILWQTAEGFWLLDRHLARLEASAGYFGYPFDRQEVEQRLGQAIVASDSALKLRLLLDNDGNITITVSPCSPPAARDFSDLSPTGKQATLLPITISPQAIDSRGPWRYHKTTHRARFNKERQRALDQGFAEVIFTNERGEITEGSTSNIFLRQGGQMVTPEVGCGLLAGACRADLLAKHRGIVEKPLRSSDLAQADAIYLTNSIRGIIEVRFIPPG